VGGDGTTVQNEAVRVLLDAGLAGHGVTSNWP